MFRCEFWVDVSRFSPSVTNLSSNKNICCGLKKVVAKSAARVYFEQQMLALLLIFRQTHNLSRNKFARVARQVEGFCTSYFDAFRESDLIIRLYSLCKTGANNLSLRTFPFTSTNVLNERSTQEVAGSRLIINSPLADFLHNGANLSLRHQDRNRRLPYAAAMVTRTVTPLQERGMGSLSKRS